jgi:hypothetical protein
MSGCVEGGGMMGHDVLDVCVAVRMMGHEEVANSAGLACLLIERSRGVGDVEGRLARGSRWI